MAENIFGRRNLAGACYGSGGERSSGREERRTGWTGDSRRPEFFRRPASELTIARALVSRPEILILDDSASALDFATDAALRRALKEETRGMTVSSFPERAAAVRRADRILVLDDGRMAGWGTHAQLVKNCPVYREICLSQFSGKEAEQL